MVTTGPQATQRECQICLEKVDTPYLLECADMYCWECIKGFGQSQKKRKITPAGPLGIHEIKGDWLTNLLEGDRPPPPPPVRQEQPIEENLALPVPQGIQREEQKGGTYFCPSCQEGEALLNIDNNPTKANGRGGHVFCVDGYQEWGANDVHRGIRQVNGNVNVSIDRNNLVGNNNDNGLPNARNAECPKGTMRSQVKNDSVFGKGGVGEHQFGIICKKDYKVGHRFDPFLAGGLKYGTEEEGYGMPLTWYLFLDIWIIAQVILLTPVLDNISCDKFGDVIGAIFIMLFAAFVSLLGICLSIIGLLIFPLCALSRFKELKRRIERTDNYT